MTFRTLTGTVCAMLITLLGACTTGDDPFDPNDPDVPNYPDLGGDGGDDGNSDNPSFNNTIQPYDGQLANDRDKDIVGTDKDIYWEANNFSTKLTIVYSGNNVTINNPTTDIICYNEGAHVVVDMLTNSVSGVEIEISGTSNDGSLKVYGDKKYMLTLNGVSLTSTRGPAINSQCKKRIFVNVPDGTKNTLIDAATYKADIKYLNGGTVDTEDRKGCFFSEGHLIFSGYGLLQTGGKMKHGIVTDGYMLTRPGVTIAVTESVKNAIHVKGDTDDGIGVKIIGGLIYTNTSGSAGKGIKTDYNAEILGGQLDLNTSGAAIYDTTEKDTSSASGIKADGDIIISGGEISIISTGIGGKGINAEGNMTISGGSTTVVTTGKKYTYSSKYTSSPKGVKIDGDILISGGELNISSTGNSDSTEALESKKTITVTGGSVYAYAYDDAINAATDFTISGGRVYALALNNDGIDSNGTIHIKGGLAISVGASGVEESFDCDKSANLIITGGTAIGVAGGSLTPCSSSTQRTVVYNRLSGTKDKTLAILDSSGTPIMTFLMPKTLSSMSLIYTSPLLKSGSYTVSSGGTVTGTTDSWNGWTTGGTWSGGSSLGSFTSNSIITTVGSSSGRPW